MAFGYTELTLALDSKETLDFNIKDIDGVATDLASFSAGVCSITHIKSGTSKLIGTVAIQPNGLIGRISVTILSTDVISSDTFYAQEDYDLYGTPQLNFALSVKLDDEVKVRSKVRMVKVG